MSTLREGAAGVVCDGCGKSWNKKDGKIFLTDVPHDAPLPKKSDKYSFEYKNWSPFRKANYSFLKKELLHIPRNSVVLDIGAGRAFYPDIIERFNEYISVDFYPYKKIDVIADISEKLPIKDKSADVVLSLNVLEHMPHIDLSIHEYARILRPGGLFVGITPFIMWLHDEPYDFNRPTKYAIRNFLEEAGFEKISLEPLSDFFDIHRSLERDFFHSLLEKNGGPGRKIFTRALRKNMSVALILLQKMYGTVKDDRWPPGYGFSGRKK